MRDTMEEEKQVKVLTQDGERLLTEAETKRYYNLVNKTKELIEKGYTRRDCLLSVKTANITGNLVMLVPIAILCVIYVIVNGFNFMPKAAIAQYGGLAPLYGLLAFLVSIAGLVVHELIHGIFWAMGARRGWKDVQFGFIKKNLTPYCTCLSPIKKPIYIIGALMPMMILGIGVSIVAILMGNPFIMLFGIVHVFGGAGDILIIAMVLKKVEGRDVLIFDHPYDCGFILFEKK